MIYKIKGHFERIGNDKYLVISPENNDIIQKHQKVFDEIKEIIKKINDYSYSIKYDDHYMKIKFDTDDIIPFNKTHFSYNNSSY